MPLTATSPGALVPPSSLFGGLDEPADRTDILVVDDLPEKLLVFETVLGELNQNIVFARSGSDALRQILLGGRGFADAA